MYLVLRDASGGAADSVVADRPLVHHAVEGRNSYAEFLRNGCNGVEQRLFSFGLRSVSVQVLFSSNGRK